MSKKSHIVMDLRNFVSWFSLLKITQIFESMNSSEILEIKGADLEMRQDLFRILPTSSYRLLNTDENEDQEGFCQVFIQKTDSAKRSIDQ